MFKDPLVHKAHLGSQVLAALQVQLDHKASLGSLDLMADQVTAATLGTLDSRVSLEVSACLDSLEIPARKVRVVSLALEVSKDSPDFPEQQALQVSSSLSLYSLIENKFLI